MLSFKSFLVERTLQTSKIDKFPKIGWWLNNDPMIFYHGTHESNVSRILESGIKAPTSGPTAGWVSLALEPSTAHGYAAMGGESGFRAAGAKARQIPHEERVTLVLEIPKSFVLKNMAQERGAMQSTKNRLTDENEYKKLVTKGKMSDAEYYALTEIRLPKVVDPKYIKRYGYLRGKK